MDDWQGRVGWVIPSWNTVTEYEVPRLMSESVSSHFARIHHTADTEEAFVAMLDEAPRSVTLLAHADLDVTVFACTAATFFRGRPAERQLAEQLNAIVEMPVVTMADAIVQAIQHVGARRVVVGAPYEQWLGVRLVSYLHEAGIEVLGAAFLGEQANIGHTPDKARELARQAWRGDAEAIVISCGNFRTLEEIEPIEAEYGVPMVTSIGAAAWAASRIADLPNRHGAPGALFRSKSTMPAAVPGAERRP